MEAIHPMVIRKTSHGYTVSLLNGPNVGTCKTAEAARSGAAACLILMRRAAYLATKAA